MQVRSISAWLAELFVARQVMQSVSAIQLPVQLRDIERTGLRVLGVVDLRGFTFAALVV